MADTCKVGKCGTVVTQHNSADGMESKRVITMAMAC